MSFANLPKDFDLLHLSALGLVFAMWWLYTPILKFLGRGTLNTQLHVVRLKWMLMHVTSKREHRVIDAIILGQISSAMSYFGSATLIVLAGFVGALASIGHIHASLSQVSFFPAHSLELFTVYFAAITLIITRCFFSFTYGLRKLAYTMAMIGGLDEGPTETQRSKVMVAQTAIVLTEAVKSMNSGIRGFYFAVAGLTLFIGPVLSMITTLAMGLLLYYRQAYSTEALAIENYVRALREDA